MATFIFIAAIGFFVASWLGTRKGNVLMPFDSLSLLLVLLFGPVILLNPLAENEVFDAGHNRADAEYGLFVLSCMYLVLGLACFLRRVIVGGRSVRFIALHYRSDDVASSGQSAYRAGICLSFIFLLSVGWSPEFWASRLDVIRFYAGQLNYSEYENLRRFVHRDSFVVNDILGRLRFTLVPLAYGLLIWSSFVEGIKMRRLIFSIVVFFLFASSLSKLPLIYYLAYSWLVLIYARGGGRRGGLGLAKLLALAPVAFCVLLALLGLMLCFQYPRVFPFPDGYIEAVKLANYRVSLVLYEVFLRYMKLYPEVLDFVSLNSSKLLSALLDNEFRNIDKEVAYYTFGAARETTSPTIFVAGAYAQFGLFGVFLYSALVAIVVILAERMLVAIKSKAVSVVIYASLIVNVTFFVQLQALTVLLTYGVGVCFVLLAMVLIKERVSFRSAPLAR